jgi:hypothetical protein
MSLLNISDDPIKNKRLNCYCPPIESPNYKANRNFNTNYANISTNIRRSQRLILNGHSQQINNVSRWGGQIQFGNFYLGKPLQLNYLGRMEGQPGGGGVPPKNKF